MKRLERAQRFLYTTRTGRRCLKALTSPSVSEVAGKLFDSKWSTCAIPLFIKLNKVDLCECAQEQYCSMNDFFSRRLKDGARTFPLDGKLLGSPADGKISVFGIRAGSSFFVKQTHYTVDRLLGGDGAFSERFVNGVCVVVRLEPKHYHRYCYIDNAEQITSWSVEGLYHTVHPSVHMHSSAFAENAREIAILQTEHFGLVAQIEVGAMLVGRIVNGQRGACTVYRGHEKGYFEFGGSTIVLFFQDGVVDIEQVIWEATARGMEVPVRQGQIIGKSLT